MFCVTVRAALDLSYFMQGKPSTLCGLLSVSEVSSQKSECKSLVLKLPNPLSTSLTASKH